MTDELYSKKLPLTIRIQDHEDRKSLIQITVELCHLTTPLARKELIIRLTDEKDLFFLFTLRLSAEDFQGLKVQQGLLVDFGAFPQKFIDLLELCIQEEHKEIPKFVLQLVCNGTSLACAANLNIIETNQFKHLTHLSLKFLPGTDSDIKRYLAECLKTMKVQNETMVQRSEHTEADLSTQLRQAREALNSRTVELNSIKGDWTTRINELNNLHGQEMNIERDKKIQMQANLQQKFEKERKELEQGHLKIVKQWESRYYDLETANKNSTEFKYKTESTVREQKSRLSLLEEENQRLKQENQVFRKDNSALLTDCHEDGKLMNQMKTRIAVLEQEMKDKEEVMKKHSDLLETERDARRKLQEEVDEKKRDVIKQNTARKAMAAEVQKGNDIIKKLQTDIRKLDTQLKLRTHVSTEQEKDVKERHRDLEELRRLSESTRIALYQKEEENKKLNESYETTLQKLEESRQLLKTNEEVINWLNRQLTESQTSSQRHEMSSQYGSASGNYYRPSSTMQNKISSGQLSFGQTSSSSVPLPVFRQSSVQYQMPGKASSLAGPLQQNKSSGNTERVYAQQSSPNTVGRTNADEGFLDPKYLQQHQGEDGVRFRLAAQKSSSPPSIHFPSSQIPTTSQNSKPQDGRSKLPQPPLVSAYFPSKVS